MKYSTKEVSWLALWRVGATRQESGVRIIEQFVEYLSPSLSLSLKLSVPLAALPHQRELEILETPSNEFCTTSLVALPREAHR